MCHRIFALLQGCRRSEAQALAAERYPPHRQTIYNPGVSLNSYTIFSSSHSKLLLKLANFFHYLLSFFASVTLHLSFALFKEIGPPPDLPSLLLNNRIIYVGMPLVPSVTELVIAQLLYLNYQNDALITLYLNSPGEIVPTFTLLIAQFNS